jgi:uncharacterized protein
MNPSTAEVRRAAAWVKDQPVGVEYADLQLAADHLTAVGVAIGSEPLVYRLDYQLETDQGFVTSRLRVIGRGEGWRRELDLRRDDRGGWSITTHEEGSVDLPPSGGDADAFADALDCDLGLSPVTNMMPILRHDLLHGGGPIEFNMAWIEVPMLRVHADQQRYRHVTSAPDHHVVRFEAVDGTFAADITLDPDAVVVDYPHIARRLGDGVGSPPG